jgi:dephospho-CoA kinase
MLKIGLTGAIGSGKTTVARLFSLLGVPVYEADAEAKRLLASDETLQRAVRERFGDAVFAGGRPVPERLAAHVFDDERALRELNAMVHPAVAADFLRWAEKQQAPYVVHVAAILFEAGADRGLDHVVAVTAPEPLRRRRTLGRYADPAEFDRRQASQWPEAEKAARAGFVVCNDETEPVIPQVLALHEKFLRLAS